MISKIFSDLYADFQKVDIKQNTLDKANLNNSLNSRYIIRPLTDEELNFLTWKNGECVGCIIKEYKSGNTIKLPLLIHFYNPNNNYFINRHVLSNANEISYDVILESVFMAALSFFFKLDITKTFFIDFVKCAEDIGRMGSATHA